jgi:hypothetical protein
VYSDYDFCLYWDELPEDFREEKITEVLAKSGEEDNPNTRYDVERHIEAHFPIYF